MAAGTKEDAETIAREARRDAGKLKRRGEEDRAKRKPPGTRTPAAPTPDTATAVVTSEAGGADLVRGLKREVTPQVEKPYDPFDGHAGLMQRDYFTQSESYPSRYLDPIRTDVRMLAGGYDLREYYTRTLVEAFSGLGCFVDEEVKTSTMTEAQS